MFIKIWIQRPRWRKTIYFFGKFIFEIVGKDLCHRMFEGGTEQIYGGEGQNGVPVTTAIKEYMTRGSPPNIGNVRFLKMENGNSTEIVFENDGTLGPKGKWTASGQDKLSTCLRWLSGLRTSNKKGFIPQYNSLVPNGELIFWEDTKPTEVKPDSYWDENCLGVYIYNGGKDSPVLEFNPRIRWDFSRLVNTGGNLSNETVNALETPGSKTPGRDIPGLDANSNPGAGQNTQTTPTETHKDNYGNNATKIKQKGDDAAARALKILHDNIEADLVIVGDPTMLPPIDAMWSKNITIIVINPFFISQSNGVCGDWLAQPICNEVLSSKAWICKSINHRIEAGNYTTTIGVFLTAPGIDIPPDSPLGGWTGGWKPPF